MQVYQRKADMPLNVVIQAHDLVLYFVGFRKRNFDKVSFSGLTREECLAEAREYLTRKKGKYVGVPEKSMPFGCWTSCTLEKNERDGFVTMWKKSSMIRHGEQISESDFESANGRGQ